MSAGALNFERILTEIADKALQCGRDPEEITLVAVSKNHGWDEIEPLYEAGAHCFGENRIQEALPKIEQAPEDIEWHLIGTLQKNKVRKAVENFALIHSVDNISLAKKIASVSVELGVSTSILLQVNVSGEESKHGFSPEELRRDFYELYVQPGIRIEGLMTMAPYHERQERIRSYFSELRYLAREFGLRHLSMGMSQDWQIAIEEGATLLRIGTALFGDRK